MIKDVYTLKIPKIILICFLVFTVVGCDQITKVTAQSTLSNKDALIYLNNLIRLEYAENPGAFLSLGAELSEPNRFLIFTVATAVFLFALSLILLFKKQDPLSLTGYSLILGGGIGNLIDRVTSGRVIDFINLGFGNLRTGIFNIADVAIVSGVLFVLISTYINSNKKSHQS